MGFALPFVNNYVNEVSIVKKSVNESISGSGILQSDDELYLSLKKNKSYTLEGVIFADSRDSTISTADVIGRHDAERSIKIGFSAPNGARFNLGLIGGNNSVILGNSGDNSYQFRWGYNAPLPIYIKGNLTTGSSSGEIRLNWAQGDDGASQATVLEGSFLRVEEFKETRRSKNE